MKPEVIIENLVSGKIDKDQALDALKSVENLGFANLDWHREKRTGFAEVIFGQGKSLQHLTKIIGSLLEGKKTVFVTRLDPEIASEILKTFPSLKYKEEVS